MCSRQARNDTALTHQNASSSSACGHTQSLITNFFSGNHIRGNNQNNKHNSNSSSGSASNIAHQHQHRDINPTDISSLPIYYNNVRSIVNKRNLCTRIDLSIYKVLCFTETFLTSAFSSSTYFPNRFTVYRCDRQIDTDRRSGGVAVLVHSSIPSKHLQIAADPLCEFLAIEIKIKPTPLILFNCYLNKFEANVANMHVNIVKQLVSDHPNHRILVVGDFNVYDIQWALDEDEECFVPYTNVLENATNHRSQYLEAAMKFLQDMSSIPLYQMSNIMNDANNVLDLVFTNNAYEVNVCVDQNTIVEVAQQDQCHIPYEITLDYCEKSSTAINSFRVNSYARGNYERMCQQLENINFAHEFNTRDTVSAYDFFQSTMKALIENNVPTVLVRNYENKPKWWTADLQRKKNRRNKLFKNKPKGVMTDEYVAACNEFDELHKRLHSEYIERVQNNIKSNPAEFWKFAKMTTKSQTYPSNMQYRNEVSTTESEMAELFADYFESIYAPDDEEWNFNDVYHEPEESQEINVSLDCIELAINSLKWKSGAGPDEISPFVVKKCVDAIVWPIWLLYQKTFDNGQIPEALKTSRVVPVYKKGKKSDVTNYRVIAISSVIMKIFETAMKFQLNAIVEPKLSNAQHGFRANRSVQTNLLSESSYVHKAFARGFQVDMFLGDFETAFDKLWIRRMIAKLSTFGIGPKTAKWLCEFLINRKSFVKIGNSKSRSYSTPSGVPAGSIL
ncbi:MAG: hypothetical protein EOP45_06005, partial [Sphingobacteriaceae bacterium]